VTVYRIQSFITASLVVFAFPLVVLNFNACSTAPRLTEGEMAKLHPQIQRLLAGESVPDVEDFSSPRPDGSREYPLIVRMGDPSELDAIGLRAQSRVGEAVTVRATLKEIESLARLSSVVSIEPGSRNEPTNKID
jgi:hypothetical protein